MKNRFKKLFLSIGITLIGASISMTPISFFTLSNNHLENKIENIDMRNASNETTIQQNDLNLDATYKNTNHESPYGIVKIVGTTIRLTSYFNSVSWTYDLLSTNSLLTKVNNGTPLTASKLEDIRIKYSSINDTYFIYGIIKNNSSSLNGGFFFQISAKDGKNFIVNENNFNSIFVKNDLTKIEDIVINPDNGNVIIIPTFSTLTTENTKVYIVNSYTYSSIQKELKTALNALNFTYSNQKFANTFVVNEKLWGLTYVVTSGATSSRIGSYKYAYLLFDFDLKKYGKSAEFELNDRTNSTISKIYENEIILNTPLIFETTPNGSRTKTYKFIQSFSNPIFSNTFTNEASIGTNYLNIHSLSDININNNNNPVVKFSDSSNIYYRNQNNITQSSDYVLASIKPDYKNKRFFVSLNKVKETNKVDFSSYAFVAYSFGNDNNLTVNLIANDSGNTSTNNTKKTIPFFSVINDPLNTSTKSSIVTEVVSYDIGTDNSITSTTNISSIVSKRIKYETGTSWSEQNDWRKFKVLDYKEKAKNSTYKNKLPSDILDSEITNWIKVIDDSNAGYTLTNSLVDLAPTNGYTLSLSKKKLFNNDNGKLKVNVKSDINKWWFESASNDAHAKETFYTTINLDIFGSIDKLKFELVTSGRVDQSKWNKINNDFIGVKKPSHITANDIANYFIKTGDLIKITESEIEMVNGDTGATKQTNKPITVRYSDRDGIITISYDVSSLSSDGMGVENPQYLSGNHIYSGFVKTSEFIPITIDETRFAEYKKTKLPYQFTISELLEMTTYSPIFKDSYRWTIEYSHKMGTEEYKKNLLNGTADFTLKYNAPSNFDEELKKHTELKIQSNDPKGQGCLKLSDVVGKSIQLEEGRANKITGGKNLDYVKNNIQSIIKDVLIIDKNWFNASEFLPTFNSIKSTSTKAVFDLSFKNDILNTNIFMSENGNSLNQRLVLDESLIKEVKQFEPNPLNLSQLELNYDVVTYKWNYDVEQVDNNKPTIDINKLSTEINNSSINGKKYGNIYPSEFTNHFKENTLKFNEFYPLIGLNYSNNDKNDPRYFELSNIVLVSSDNDGSVVVKYELFYPNLSDFNRVIENPEIVLTGFKSNGLYVVLGIAASIFILFLLLSFIIATPFYLTIRRQKHLNKK